MQFLQQFCVGTKVCQMLLLNIFAFNYIITLTASEMFSSFYKTKLSILFSNVSDILCVYKFALDDGRFVLNSW